MLGLLLFCTQLVGGLSVHNEMGYVDGGSLISLSSADSVPDQLKMDFLESTLYAQLNASAVFDREENGMGWYVRYVSILRHLGWNVTDPHFKVEKRRNVSWMDTIEDVFTHELNVSQRESLNNAMLSFLRSPASSDVVQLFNRVSTKGDISTFQIIPAFVKDGENLVAWFGLFSTVELESSSANVQTVGIMSSISFGMLDGNVYGKYRNKIQKELADNVKKMILSLTL